MQSHILEKMGRMHRWRQYAPHLHPQSARHDIPSSHHQAFRPLRNSKHSRYVVLPTVPPKNRPEPLKIPRAYPTDGSQRTSFKSRWHDWAKNHRYIVRCLVVFGSGTIIFYGFLSQSVPITGRRRLDYVPDWITKFMEKIREEKGEGRRIEKLRNLSWGSENPQMQGPISVFNRLIHASGLDDREWEFRIVNAPSMANAEFNNGLVLVFSGIFRHPVKNEDELAAVLAHEIAHVLANHERESKSMLAIAGIVSFPLRWLRQLMPELNFEGPNRAIVSCLTHLRRRQEMEADYIGMTLMADAGFNPSATTGMWKKMKEMKDLAMSAHPRVQQVPQWMSSHPDTALRISYTEKWIPEILEILGKPASGGVAVRTNKLKAKKRRWNNFVKQRDERRSKNRGNPLASKTGPRS